MHFSVERLVHENDTGAHGPRKKAIYQGINYFYTLGTTNAVSLISGIKKYAKYKNKRISVNHKSGPSFQFFKNAIDKNLSSILIYTVNVKGSGEESHVVSVIGYMQIKNSNSKIVFNYLIVADGWHNDEPRCFVYDDPRVAKICGIIMNF